jgi:hypothetical protein
MAEDEVGERPQRQHQRRYEQSTRGRETNRERQRRYINKLKVSLAEVERLEAELANHRKAFRDTELGLTLRSSPKEIADILWAMPGAKKKLFGNGGVVDLLIRRHTNNKTTLAALLRDND